MTGAAPPLVLLHPLGSDGRFWEPVVRELLGVEPLALDLPGHGGSPPLSPGEGIDDMADRVAARLEELGLARVDLVGVSLGGLVAQTLAARLPGLVRRLALVDTVASYPQPMRQMWRDRAATARRDGLAGLSEGMLATWFSDEFRDRESARVEEVREVFLSMSTEGYVRSCEALEGADTTTLVPGIDVPTLVVCGSEDGPAFLAAAAWLHERLAGPELLWLQGCRHAAVLERPREFAAALHRLVSE